MARPVHSGLEVYGVYVNIASVEARKVMSEPLPAPPGQVTQSPLLKPQLAYLFLVS